MRNSILLIILSSLALLALGCGNGDEGKVLSADEQTKVEAAIPKDIQNANIPSQAKAAAIQGQARGRMIGQAMNKNTGQ